MILNDKKINEMIYGNIVQTLADSKNISISEARTLLTKMSFSEFCKLEEVAGSTLSITPPSGNTVGPQSTSQQTNQQSKAPSGVKAIWPGAGAPVEIGMSVGVKGANGVPMPSQVTQVDMGAKGVKVKNPTTGQDQWMNIADIQPGMTAGGDATNSQTQQSGQSTIQPTTEEVSQIKRLQELAGVSEDCSGGATGAGAIAISPTSMGRMNRRQPTEETAQKVEYTRTEPSKSIIGDTKPSQASGKLSADLAARGKKTASRINNGMDE